MAFAVSNGRKWLQVIIIIFILLALHLVGCGARSAYHGKLYFSDGYNLIEQDMSSGNKIVALRLRTRANGADISRTHYDVSGDNRYIAYVETSYARGPKKVNRVLVIRHLVVIDRFNRKKLFYQTLTPSVEFPIAFSPDGKLLAIISYSQTRDGTPMLSIVRLSDGKAILSSIPAYNDSATWSADGRQVGITDAWIRPIVIGLSDKKKTVLPGSGSPKYSPDGAFIVIDKVLWRVKERKMAKLYLPERAIVTGWTPDSKSLLYTYEDAFKRYPLYIYRIKSRTVRKIMSDNGGCDTYPTIWRRS